MDKIFTLQNCLKINLSLLLNDKNKLQIKSDKKWNNHNQRD